MAQKITRKDIRKIFDDKERLLKRQPSLGQLYSHFLQNWEQYKKSQEESEKSKKSRAQSVFGVLFKE